MKRRWNVLLVAGSLIIGALCMYMLLAFTEPDERDKAQEQAQSFKQSSEKKDTDDLDKIEKAFYLIKRNYVEETDEKKLIEGAVEGMLATLNDPYSVYMDEETVKQFNETLDSTFEGIGAEVSIVDGKVVIVAPFKDSPAEKAGLKPNDQILSVDGESVEGLDLFETTLRIRGEKGTIVKLEIAREGLSEPFLIEITRDEIPQITVYSKLKRLYGKDIGYIQITSFAEETAKEFKKALKELEKKGIDGLILDVRENPGGLLPSVEEIVKEFVTTGHPYVQIEKRNGEKVEYFSTLEKKKDYPLAVLIDKGSASASEILAGALKEAEGYPLIGEKTFGKGTVQQSVEMGDGSNIKLTVFKWLTPDGNWIHKKGIQPDIEVSQPRIFHIHPLHIEKTLETDMNNEQVKRAQQMLSVLGFEPGREDGYFSQGTETAVKAFQNQKGLDATGKIDKQTASALESSILEELKKEKNDLQLQTALRYIAKQ